MSGTERLETKPISCPHCGSLYEPIKITEWNITEWKLTTQFGQVILQSALQSKIFDLLWRKQGIRGLTCQRIIDIIFMGDIEGGPEPTAITMAVNRMRKQLVSAGVFLNRGWTGGEGYSLIFTTPEQAGLKLQEHNLKSSKLGRKKCL